MAIPGDIVESVRSGKCILFLGAMASAATPPQGSPFIYKGGPPGAAKLSKRLARICRYPHRDVSNLQRVSLFFELQKDRMRSGLINAIFREITGPHITPSPALQILAALPFRFVITTNYDQLFEQALRLTEVRPRITKNPIIRVYDPNRNGPPEQVPLDPSEDRPVLLKLHGDIDKPESIVVTEEDYITFIQRMSNPHFHPIHEKIRSRMMEWPVLFVGYSLRDYNLRLLFRTLRWNVDPASLPVSFSVDPYPDNLIVSVYQNGTQPMVNFIEEDLWKFVPELYEAYTGRGWKP